MLTVLVLSVLDGKIQGTSPSASDTSLSAKKYKYQNAINVLQTINTKKK